MSNENLEKSDSEAGLLDRFPWLSALPGEAELRDLRTRANWDSGAAETLKRAVAKLKALHEAAAQDEHGVLAPTHIAERGGEIIGAASICAMPFVNIWAHSGKCKPRDSLTLLNMVEREVVSLKCRTMMMPCAQESPYRPFMAALGFKFLANTDLFVKELKR